MRWYNQKKKQPRWNITNMNVLNKLKQLHSFRRKQIQFLNPWRLQPSKSTLVPVLTTKYFKHIHQGVEEEEQRLVTNILSTSLKLINPFGDRAGWKVLSHILFPAVAWPNICESYFLVTDVCSSGNVHQHELSPTTLVEVPCGIAKWHWKEEKLAVD